MSTPLELAKARACGMMRDNVPLSKAIAALDSLIAAAAQQARVAELEAALRGVYEHAMCGGDTVQLYAHRERIAAICTAALSAPSPQGEKP